MDALADPLAAPGPATARPQLDLELRGIRKRYGDFTAVDGVRCVAGLEEPDDGDLLIGGKEVTRDPPWQRDIAMMFQDFVLFPHMTVARSASASRC